MAITKAGNPYQSLPQCRMEKDPLAVIKHTDRKHVMLSMICCELLTK